MCVHTSNCGVQKQTPDPWPWSNKLELQGAGESNSGPLQRQQALLTAEPPLQSQNSFVKKIISCLHYCQKRAPVISRLLQMTKVVGSGLSSTLAPALWLKPMQILSTYSGQSQFGIRMTELNSKRWHSCLLLTALVEITFSLSSLISRDQLHPLPWDPIIASLHPRTFRGMSSTSPLPVNVSLPSYKNTSDYIYGSHRQPRKYILSLNLR